MRTEQEQTRGDKFVDEAACREKVGCQFPERDVIPAQAGTYFSAETCGELGPCLRRDDIE